MTRRIAIEPRSGLDAYEAVAHLTGAVRELREQARVRVPRLQGRTVWMINSTAQGGGVAEMLPTVVTLLRELGVATEWVVIDSDDPDFFVITKRLHNLIHGVPAPAPGEQERACYEGANRANAQSLRELVRPGDIIVVHDPQPMPLVGQLKESGLDVHAIWRCHIGLDESTEATRSAWRFLSRYESAYERAVFSAPEYVPDFFRTRAVLIHPAIDPLSQKNRELALHKVVGTLANSGLASAPGPMLTPHYEHQATRLRPGGGFTTACAGDQIGLLSRPIITQVSRWDRLKGLASSA